MKSITAHLLRRKQPFVDGLVNLNAAVQAPMMLHVLDVQLRHQLQKTFKKIHRIVLDDRKVKVREIADIVKISTERVRNILHEHLHMKKLCARWVPRFLTIDQKQQRVDDSERGLKLFQRNPNEFLRRFVTMDETWIHHYTPESNRQSAEWLQPGESRPKRPKTQQSAGKVLASIFWDARGIIFIDYLEKGKTVTGEYYAASLDRLNEEITKKAAYGEEKSALSPRQCTGSHIHESDGKIE